MPRMWTPLLSSATHRRISPGLYFVGAACRMMVLDCFAGGAGHGAGPGFGFCAGIAFAPVASDFLGGRVAGGGECLGAFGPVVGCLPLSFLVDKCVVEVAASA